MSPVFNCLKCEAGNTALKATFYKIKNLHLNMCHYYVDYI